MPRNSSPRDFKEPLLRYHDMLLCAMLVALGMEQQSFGAVIYQSALSGPTGISTEQLLNQTVPGSNVSGSNFVGVRFYVDAPVVTTRIGGHFGGSFGGSVDHT